MNYESNHPEVRDDIDPFRAVSVPIDADMVAALHVINPRTDRDSSYASVLIDGVPVSGLATVHSLEPHTKAVVMNVAERGRADNFTGQVPFINTVNKRDIVIVATDSSGPGPLKSYWRADERLLTYTSPDHSTNINDQDRLARRFAGLLAAIEQTHLDRRAIEAAYSQVDPAKAASSLARLFRRSR